MVVEFNKFGNIQPKEIYEHKDKKKFGFRETLKV